ncbi:MAG: hypothetical protein A4S09_03130 [Proteobacteria bacterium SG_bin7]|nr:MAG: hypothetical protein A4S09_03130 [Proteobacteria bacterium SG_bin7]
MCERAEYKLRLTVNGQDVRRVIIDQHYKLKHSDVTDEIILQLVKELDGGNFPIEEIDDDFRYFRVEPVYHDDKPYRLVLLICIADDFLGVINAFRVKR